MSIDESTEVAPVDRELLLSLSTGDIILSGDIFKGMSKEPIVWRVEEVKDTKKGKRINIIGTYFGVRIAAASLLITPTKIKLHRSKL